MPRVVQSVAEPEFRDVRNEEAVREVRKMLKLLDRQAAKQVSKSCFAPVSKAGPHDLRPCYEPGHIIDDGSG